MIFIKNIKIRKGFFDLASSENVCSEMELINKYVKNQLFHESNSFESAHYEQVFSDGERYPS